MPPDTRLFPPEKCSSSTSPTHRVENENKRNWETIRFQYDRLKKEKEAEKVEDVPEEPLNELAQLKKCWPDPLMVKALGMANPMDVSGKIREKIFYCILRRISCFQFSLPPEYLLEREYFPYEPLEEKRAPLVGIECTKCNL